MRKVIVADGSGPGGNARADRRHTPRDAKNARNESRNEMNARRRVRAGGRSLGVASSPQSPVRRAWLRT